MRSLTRGDFLRLLAAIPAGALLGTHVRAAEPQVVTVGCIQLPTNGPLYIAMDRGYFAKQGLRVEIRWFTAAATVFSAVVSRDADIGMTATTAATFNLAAKGGFRIIAGSTRDAPHFPLNAFLISNRAFDKGFTGPAGMAGHRIAMTTAGSSHHYFIGQMARKYDVALSSIDLVPLENYGNIIAALQTGQVDAAILPPSQAQRLLDAKSAHFVAWTGDEVPEQQGILFASPQTLASKHDTILKFMQAYVEGAQDYRRNFNEVDAQGKPVKGPDHDALVTIIARYAGITPAAVEGQVAYIVPDARPDQADIMRQIAFWQEQGMVPKGADFRRLFDLSFLPAGPA